jgi:leucyl-tRNA synthetase
LDKQEKVLNQELNRLGIKCTNEFDHTQFNTAISSIMELVNAASRYVNATKAAERNNALCLTVARTIVLMMAPIAPHWSEELWHEALQQTGSVYNEPWPTLDEKQAQSDTIEIAVQVMGKLRGHAQVAKDASKGVVEETAKKAVAHYIEGKTIRKVIVVPGRLVNIVAN